MLEAAARQMEMQPWRADLLGLGFHEVKPDLRVITGKERAAGLHDDFRSNSAAHKAATAGASVNVEGQRLPVTRPLSHPTRASWHCDGFSAEIGSAVVAWPCLPPSELVAAMTERAATGPPQRTPAVIRGFRAPI